MINLDEWRDYQSSSNKLNMIKRYCGELNSSNTKNIPRLLRAGAISAIEQGCFVEEDIRVAMNLVGIDAKTS